MDEKNVHTRHSIFWPLLLVAAGGILLLTNLNALPGNLWDYISRYWPLLFILGGLDQIYQGRGWVGGIITLGLGGVLLAGNLGLLPWSGLDLLLRLWPVFIVALGLDLMMQGRTSGLATVVIVLLALAVVAGMVFIGFAGPTQMGMSQVEISQPLEGAQRATVNMTLISGDAQYAGGSGRNQLIDGTLYLPNRFKTNASYSVSGGEGHYELKPESSSFMPFISPYQGSANFKLNSDIPTSFELTLIAGKQSLDLRSINATDLNVETVFGETVITLPEEGKVNGKVGVVFGELVVRVPRGTAVQFKMDTVVVGKNIPQDFLRTEDTVSSPEAASGKADIVLSLENVVGSVKIEYLP